MICSRDKIICLMLHPKQSQRLQSNERVGTLKLCRPGLILSQIFSTSVHLLNLFDLFESVSPCVKSRIMIPMPRRIF